MTPAAWLVIAVIVGWLLGSSILVLFLFVNKTQDERRQE